MRVSVSVIYVAKLNEVCEIRSHIVTSTHNVYVDVGKSVERAGCGCVGHRGQVQVSQFCRWFCCNLILHLGVVLTFLFLGW